ncbi:DUF1552 domain-containing protein [Psychrosphaera sp. B3R10]|nr:MULTISPECIES: DUF1552 domain-containing protein [unclassified Psychrosphaera]MBU2880571.1 DUF1552 domain-containing protein [Psychrosphaera sp. I2R16]MBU2989108.1 DUF1552 domain-containing protein [Psychrosphaera sp. B3R10]MDO6717764.1 DUF1552 domain-containing protein [Psychrosphaera sp. 1_MG-2023]
MNYIKGFKLDRRSFIKGIGVAASLPYLECMAETKQLGSRLTAPKRMCYLYVPNGVSLPGLDSEYKQWNWFPSGEGDNYEFTNVLSSLNPHRQDLSIIGGLSHPKSRELLGHIAGDSFLTAGDLRGDYKNSISVDQYAAAIKKHNTRYPSLILSADGGVGFKSRASTLSFNHQGKALPSEHSHRQIFERYFAPDGQNTSVERKKSLHRDKKVVDLLLEDAKRLQKRLGVADRNKISEHLASLNDLEEQIKRNEAWLDIPLGAFNADHIDLAVDAKIDPQAYIRTMYDLIVLAFQLDLTEVASYMIAREDGMGLGDAYPKIQLGLKKGHHAITHDKTTGHWQDWGKYDQWLASHFSYFIDRMKNTTDQFGSLLDNTQILYGSACSNTHNARNCPLILAGGKNMGLKHGRYHKFSEDIPMSNLFLKMLQAGGVPTSQFGDSNEHLAGFSPLFTG